MLAYIKSQSVAFSPEEVIILVGAFDMTWHVVLAGGVKLEGDAEPVRAMLAKHIIESASRGELNQDRLCNDALVPRHRGFDRLIFIYSRMGKSSGATRSSMLRGTPG
jgi:hypothetical protein